MGQRTVVLELAGDHQLARDLVAGGVFVPHEQLALGEECALVLRGRGEQLIVTATCVFVNAQGMGLQVVGCDGDMKQQIAALAHSVELAQTVESEPAAEAQHDVNADGHAALDEATTETADEATTAAEAADAPDEGGDRKTALNVNERLRGLTLVQQLKVAQHGEISERIILERMYGKNVWEALLRNPRVTGPEVARIARMGALPRPLVEIIVGNGGWLQIPEVRRALLSNPRLGTDQVMRVLRLLPKHELKLAGMQTAYPFAVRDAAKRMLREMGGG